MKLEDITNDLNLAKMAARESGKLLVKSKIQINERLNTDTKDTKLRADIESELSLIHISEPTRPY